MLATEGADREELNLLLHGFKISRVLRLIADLGVADKVPTDGHITVDDLAAACAVQPEPMLRVLRMLAALKIFQVTTHGTVAQTPRSRLLRTDTPGSLHHAARFRTGPGLWKAWGMLDVAMTGGVPHEAAWNMSRFSYLLQHPDEARAFDAMMESNPVNPHAAVAAAYDFSAARLIADIGGGNGAALRQILSRFPAPRGLVGRWDPAGSAARRATPVPPSWTGRSTARLIRRCQSCRTARSGRRSCCTRCLSNITRNREAEGETKGRH